MSEPIQSTEPDQRPTVALVFGGDSSEHQVSCLTAGSVARAVDPQRYRVVGIGITRSGRWVRVPLEQIQQLQIVDRQMPSLTEDHPDAELVRTPEGVQLLTRDGGTLTDPERVDVAFALLHGPHGEDGTIQGLFELLGLRYVGSGVAASAIGMDKHLMKLAFAASGIPIGPFVVIQPHEWEKDPAASLDAVAALDFPVFVKPARGGSSVGITKVDDKEAVAAAIEEARRWDPKVLVEQGGEVSARGPGQSRCAGEDRSGDHRGAPRARRADLRHPRLRGAGAGRLLRRPDGPDLCQRDQHDARIHRHLDVSAGLAARRSGVPAADR